MTARTPDRLDLTPADLKIARLVAVGCSNREIAQRLGVQVQTVKNRLSVIYERLGTRNRVELAMRLRQHGETG